MSVVASGPTDFTLVFHNSLSDSYELSRVLLATADFDGTLQLLTSGWERALGYGREELERKTLATLMWSGPRGAAVAVEAILERWDMQPVEIRVRCRNGMAKCFTLHRRYDRDERMMYLVAEETAEKPAPVRHGRAERRAEARAAWR